MGEVCQVSVSRDSSGEQILRGYTSEVKVCVSLVLSHQTQVPHKPLPFIAFIACLPSRNSCSVQEECVCVCVCVCGFQDALMSPQMYRHPHPHPHARPEKSIRVRSSMQVEHAGLGSPACSTRMLLYIRCRCHVHPHARPACSCIKGVGVMLTRMLDPHALVALTYSEAAQIRKSKESLKESNTDKVLYPLM
jgi:hypothetical protein